MREKENDSCLDTTTQDPNCKSIDHGSSSTWVNAAKSCNCKKSRCLKQYCDCFREHQLCTESCRCSGCLNTSIDRCELGMRAAAGLSMPWAPADLPQALHTPTNFADAQLAQALERANSGSPLLRPRMERVCKCKRSRCLKRYCECYQNDQQCTQKCSCTDCGNGPTASGSRAAAGANPGSDDNSSPGSPMEGMAASAMPTAADSSDLSSPACFTTAPGLRHKLTSDGHRPLLPHGQ
jgi:hypothetical protein